MYVGGVVSGLSTGTTETSIYSLLLINVYVDTHVDSDWQYLVLITRFIIIIISTDITID